MGFWGLAFKSCRRQIGRLFSFGSKSTKVLTSAVKTPVPVGRVAATEATKPAGFWARLAELRNSQGYQGYREVMNNGVSPSSFEYLW